MLRASSHLMTLCAPQAHVFFFSLQDSPSGISGIRPMHALASCYTQLPRVALSQQVIVRCEGRACVRRQSVRQLWARPRRKRAHLCLCCMLVCMFIVEAGILCVHRLVHLMTQLHGICTGSFALLSCRQFERGFNQSRLLKTVGCTGVTIQAQRQAFHCLRRGSKSYITSNAFVGEPCSGIDHSKLSSKTPDDRTCF